MAYWHEAPQDTGGWTFLPGEGGRVAAIFRGTDVRKAPFQGHFLRYEGTGEAQASFFSAWRKNSEGWFELWPLNPMLATSSQEAKQLFQPLLPQIENGSLDAQFERRPYQPPVTPHLVKEIEHATHVAMARIVQYPDGHYSVGYLVYAPNGQYLPASTPSLSSDRDYEWGITYETDDDHDPLLTLADDLGSAEEIAEIELNRFVAADGTIKQRP